MATRSNRPGALAGAVAAGMTFKAVELNLTRTHTAFDGESHHLLRIVCLRDRNGLCCPRAAPIAELAYDGGRAR